MPALILSEWAYLMSVCKPAISCFSLLISSFICLRSDWSFLVYSTPTRPKGTICEVKDRVEVWSCGYILTEKEWEKLTNYFASLPELNLPFNLLVLITQAPFRHDTEKRLKNCCGKTLRLKRHIFEIEKMFNSLKVVLNGTI